MAKHLEVVDPDGVRWDVRLRYQVVTTAQLERVIKASGRTIRKPRFWEGGRDRMGAKIPSRLSWLRPANRWERDHSYAFVVTAKRSDGTGRARSWVSPEARKADALHDLEEIAARIAESGVPQRGTI